MIIVPTKKQIEEMQIKADVSANEPEHWVDGWSESRFEALSLLLSRAKPNAPLDLDHDVLVWMLEETENLIDLHDCDYELWGDEPFYRGRTRTLNNLRTKITELLY